MEDAALLVCLGLNPSPVAKVVILGRGFVTTIISAQSVGQAGIGCGVPSQFDEAPEEEAA